MNPQDAVKVLIAAGWTEQRIASEAGTSQPTINRIKNGRHRASFDVGQALVGMAHRSKSSGESLENGVPVAQVNEAA